MMQTTEYITALTTAAHSASSWWKTTNRLLSGAYSPEGKPRLVRVPLQ